MTSKGHLIAVSRRKRQYPVVIPGERRVLVTSKVLFHSTRRPLRQRFGVTLERNTAGKTFPKGAVLVLTRKREQIAQAHFMEEKTPHGKPYMLVYKLETAQAFQREGLMTQLLSEIAHFARTQGYLELRLDVELNNRRAAELYERFGFEHLYFTQKTVSGGRLAPVEVMRYLLPPKESKSGKK